MELQDKLIRYRAKHRLSQRQMAERCGISISTMYAVETGQQKPGKLTLAKINLVLEGDDDVGKHIEN